MFDKEFTVPASAQDGRTKLRLNWILAIRLPFRLRLGRLYRFMIPDSSHWIAVRTLREIPSDYQVIKVDDPFPAWKDDLLSDPDSFMSEAVVCVDPRTINKILPAESSSEWVSAMHYGCEVLNDFLTAYRVTLSRSPNQHDGKMNACIGRFRMISEWDFRRKPLYGRVNKVWSPEGYEWTECDIDSFIDGRHKSSGRDIPTGNLHVLDQSLLDSIRSSFISSQQDIFYRFEFEARDAAYDDSIHSLLMACVALEAAHSSLLRMRLQQVAPESGAKDPDKSAENTIKKYLMQTGTFLSLEMTNAFVLSESERPSRAVLDAALEGLKARNAVMHAGRNKERFTVRKLDFVTAVRHASNVLALVQVFKKVVENDFEAITSAAATCLPPSDHQSSKDCS